MSSCPHRSWVEISRSQLARNFRAVRDAVGPEVTIVPVVKADAYRHGAIEVARVLAGEGADWFAVSCVDEGVALREAGVQGRILVMADFLPLSREVYFPHRLTPVLHSLDEVRAWDQLAGQHGAAAQYHLKIDSGMGRLGSRASGAEICDVLRGVRHAVLEGVMTHFASAADYASRQTDEQIAYFSDLCACLELRGVAPRYVHLASTIPIAYGRREAWRNMVRPGHAIYGYVSPARGDAPARTLQVAPALTWKAAILEVKDVEAGARIGYGGMFRAPRPLRIAVLAVGYADGLPHRLSNRGQVIAGGKLAPILGAVSMDVTTVDVSASPELRTGDTVTILGTEGSVSQDAQDIARVAGTISYSVLCGISARVKRIYVD